MHPTCTSQRPAAKLIGAGAILACCVAAILCQAQYNTYDSDSNSGKFGSTPETPKTPPKRAATIKTRNVLLADNSGGPILTPLKPKHRRPELAKLVRNSANLNQNQNLRQQLGSAYQHHQQQQHQAGRGRQQALQFAPTQQSDRRQFSSDQFGGAAGYSPFSGAAGRQLVGEASGLNRHNRHGTGSSNDDADDDDQPDQADAAESPVARAGAAGSAGFGFGFDPDADSSADGDNDDSPPTGLSQAASGYPAAGNQHQHQQQPGYDSFGANFGGFGAPGGADEFGSGDAGDDGRRHKSGSAPRGGFASNLDGDESTGGGGALPFGPNSAINYNGGDSDADDESARGGAAGYSPENSASNSNNNDDDDE